MLVNLDLKQNFCFYLHYNFLFMQTIHLKHEFKKFLNNVTILSIFNIKFLVNHINYSSLVVFFFEIGQFY